MKLLFLSRIFGRFSFVENEKPQAAKPEPSMPMDILVAAIRFHHTMSVFQEHGLDSSGRGFFTWFSKPDYNDPQGACDNPIIDLTLAYQLPAEWYDDDTQLAAMRREKENARTDATFMLVKAMKNEDGQLCFEAFGMKGENVILRCNTQDQDTIVNCLYDFAEFASPEIMGRSRWLHAKFDAKKANLLTPEVPRMQ